MKPSLEKNKERMQEEDYFLPYHWFMDKGTKRGRLYFGYNSLSFKSAIKHGEKNIGEAYILDAGCGDGRFLKYLQDKGGKNLYGIDYSERAIIFANLLLQDISLKEADLRETLPFEENYFDFIFLVETLEHIAFEEVSIVLKNLQLILKPNGVLIITVPSKNQQFFEHGKHYQHFSPSSLESTVSTFFDIKEMIGQDRSSFHFLKIIDQIIDNKFWSINSLRNFYNTKIWPRFLNKCRAQDGRRLVAVCQKKKS